MTSSGETHPRGRHRQSRFTLFFRPFLETNCRNETVTNSGSLPFPSKFRCVGHTPLRSVGTVSNFRCRLEVRVGSSHSRGRRTSDPSLPPPSPLPPTLVSRSPGLGPIPPAPGVVLWTHPGPSVRTPSVDRVQPTTVRTRGTRTVR